MSWNISSFFTCQGVGLFKVYLNLFFGPHMRRLHVCEPFFFYFFTPRLPMTGHEEPWSQYHLWLDHFLMTRDRCYSVFPKQRIMFALIGGLCFLFSHSNRRNIFIGIHNKKLALDPPFLCFSVSHPIRKFWNTGADVFRFACSSSRSSH